MPIERPIILAMKTLHLSAPGSSARASHFSIAQKTEAVHKADKANTIVSSDENQKVSLKANASAPTTPAPNTKTCYCAVISPLRVINLRATRTMVQYRNITVAALASAQAIFVK